MVYNPANTLLPTVDGNYVYLTDIELLIPSEEGTLVELSSGEVVSIDLEDWHLFLILNEPYTIWYKVCHLWKRFIKHGI